MDTPGPDSQPQPVAELLPVLEDAVTELAVIEQCRALCRQAYEMGRADGWREGFEHGARALEAQWQAVVEWQAIIAAVRSGASHAELELIRWGPGGRDRFGDPQPGDRFPRLDAAS